MSAIAAEGPNAAQIAYWNTAAGANWVVMQDQIDRQLRPLGLAAMDRLAPASGETVLDIGCGCGSTTLDLAARVGPTGRVLAVDISEPMIGVARTRAHEAGRTNVEYRLADAQTALLSGTAADAVFSRFGVMFFADPAAAFANIQRAVKPGGRLAFVCWRRPDENPIMTLPMAAAAPFLPPPAPPEPGAPGPFAFADPDRIRAVLGAGGFADITVTPHDEKVGAGDLDTVLAMTLKVGPLGAMLRDHPDKRDTVIAAVRTALAPHEGPDGVKLDSATWIVTARKPA